MNILVISPCFPNRTSGASTRIYYLLQALAAHHTVSLLVLALTDTMESIQHNDTSELEAFLTSVRVISHPATQGRQFRRLASLARGTSPLLQAYIRKHIQALLDRMMADQRFDAVLYESSLIAGYRLPHHVNTIIDLYDIQHELVRRTYERARPSLRKWYTQLDVHLVKEGELARCRAAAMVLVCSEREREYLKRFLPQKPIEVVANGADTDITCHVSYAHESNSIVFTGTMNYFPNIDATTFFAQHCWPTIKREVPDATLQIVGKNPSPEVQRLGNLPGITVVGAVPDVSPYLAQSALAIAPLRIGSGTRVKILEALAMGKAVVSTKLGSEGLAVQSGTHLALADEPEEFAQAVIALLRDPEKRKALGQAGRALVEREYSWERSGKQLLQSLQPFTREPVQSAFIPSGAG